MKKKIVTGKITKNKVPTKSPNYLVKKTTLVNVSKIKSEQLQNIERNDSQILLLNTSNLNEKNIANNTLPIIKAKPPPISQNELISVLEQSNNRENITVNILPVTKTKKLEKCHNVQMTVVKQLKNTLPIIKAKPPPIPQNELISVLEQSNNRENITVNILPVTKTKQLEKCRNVQMPVVKQLKKLNGENIKMNTFPIRAVKALEWTINEWFESNMDSNLFGEDKLAYEICIRDVFPNLKTRVMTQSNWFKVRAHIGKARRFSAKYIESELNLRESKRHIIRYIQTHQPPINNIIRPEDLKYLPNEVFLTLPAGTKVWVRLNRDIASGTVCGYDSELCQYKIKFDRNDLGERLILDINVKSDNCGNIQSLHKMKQFHYNILKSNKKLLEESVDYTHDLLQRIALTDIHTILRADPYYLNGVPVKLLAGVVKMRKLLDAGKKVIKDIDKINSNLELGKVMENHDPKTESLIKQSHLALLKKCIKGVIEIISEESRKIMLTGYTSFSSSQMAQEECERLLKKKVFKSENITYLIKKFIFLLCLMISCESEDICNGNLRYSLYEAIDEMELKITDHNCPLFRSEVVSATSQLVSIIEEENQ